MHFLVEITDTFGGEPNYGYVLRYKVKATTPRGAMWRIARLTGVQWRSTDSNRYDTTCGTSCTFVEEWDEEVNANLLQLNTTTLA